MMENSFRKKFCVEILTDIARQDPTLNLQDLVREFTLWDILESSRKAAESEKANGAIENWTGLLPEKDTIRFGLQLRSELSQTAIRRLDEELDRILVSISDFFHADKIESLNEHERMELAWSLLEHIQSHKDEIASRSSELATAYGRIEALVAMINESHSRLQEILSEVLARFPEDINGRRSSLNDLLATTIETSLIKLSLMRARAHQALYDFRSPTNSEATMTEALSSAYAKLKRDERKLDEEGRALDRQTEEYETMLKLVDGGAGGFAQVVEDWTRVQREKEECKRDLRRLGWTGD